MKRADLEDCRRTRPRAGAAARLDGPPPTHGARVAQRRTRAPRRCPALTGETERTAQLRLTQDGFAVDGHLGNPLAGLPADVVVAQEPPAKTAAAQRGAAGEPRGARRDAT